MSFFVKKRFTNLSHLKENKEFEFRLFKFKRAINLLLDTPFHELTIDFDFALFISLKDVKHFYHRKFQTSPHAYLMDLCTRLIYKILQTQDEYVIDVIKKYADDLDVKIQQKKSKKPLPKGLNATLWGIAAAVVVISVCTIIGGLMSIWCGGAGALPGLMIGIKVSIGAGLIGGISGYFKAKWNRHDYKADMRFLKQSRRIFENMESYCNNKNLSAKPIISTKTQTEKKLAAPLTPVRYQKVTFVLMSDKPTLSKLIYSSENKPIHPLLRHFKQNKSPEKLVKLLKNIAKQPDYQDWVEFTETFNFANFTMFKPPVPQSKLVTPEELARRINEDMADREEQRLLANLK